MKATLYDKSGKKKGDVELPKTFATKPREDIVAKFYEADKLIQPYASDTQAGNKHSASGTISHKRHDWKGHYGRGISRAPRKTMWRRGTQFYWIGAQVPGARGGRRAHPPKGIGAEKKMNKKEIILAFNSALAATVNPEFVNGRYATIKKLDNTGFVIEEVPKKTKEFVAALKNIFAENMNLILKNKTVRAGKGKTRGRKYKSNAGVLVITASDEEISMKGFDIKPVDSLDIADLYPLGRLTVYTKKAIDQLNKNTEEKK